MEKTSKGGIDRMDHKTEIERVSQQIIEGGDRYHYPTTVGIIRAIVKGDRSPYGKVRDIKVALEALDKANGTT